MSIHVAVTVRSLYVRSISLVFRHDRSYHIRIVFFFFQAEDGIRDLVRSRGLGDVYKRQIERGEEARVRGFERRVDRRDERVDALRHFACIGPVSYTHLTLPTSDLV